MKDTIEVAIEFFSDVLKVLEELPKGVSSKYFDLTHWKCGTTHCAIGWCIYTQWFSDKWGLVWEPKFMKNLSGETPWYVDKYGKPYAGWNGLVAIIVPKKEGFENEYVKEVYLFYQDLLYTCFSPDTYPIEDHRDSSTVIKRIRTILSALSILKNDSELYSIMLSYLSPYSSLIDFPALLDEYGSLPSVGEYFLIKEVLENNTIRKPPLLPNKSIATGETA